MLSCVLLCSWLLLIYAQSVVCVLVMGVSPTWLCHRWLLVSVESDMNENFVREPNVHMMLQSVLSYAYFSKKKGVCFQLIYILLQCNCRRVNECNAKCVHVCFTSNQFFSAPPEKPTKCSIHDSRLTATDEPCVHRLHLQTFGPKVRSKNREAAVCVDWCWSLPSDCQDLCQIQRHGDERHQNGWTSHRTERGGH